MPIFLLSPVPEFIRDPAWETSPYNGDAWVNGADETEARGLVAGRYEDARGNIPGFNNPAPSPWLDARLVSAKLVEAGPNGMDIPNGVVVADRQM